MKGCCNILNTELQEPFREQLKELNIEDCESCKLIFTNKASVFKLLDILACYMIIKHKKSIIVVHGLKKTKFPRKSAEICENDSASCITLRMHKYGYYWRFFEMVQSSSN